MQGTGLKISGGSGRRERNVKTPVLIMIITARKQIRRSGEWEVQVQSSSKSNESPSGKGQISKYRNQRELLSGGKRKYSLQGWSEYLEGWGQKGAWWKELETPKKKKTPRSKSDEEWRSQLQKSLCKQGGEKWLKTAKTCWGKDVKYMRETENRCSFPLRWFLGPGCPRMGGEVVRGEMTDAKFKKRQNQNKGFGCSTSK